MPAPGVVGDGKPERRQLMLCYEDMLVIVLTVGREVIEILSK